MRPILLEMSAFGPFADTQAVDFRKLGTNPLFLINGPTGSGKTTILDAICFALYGETTGGANDRQPQQMRCDQARAETLTAVSFEFELGEARYRIRRVTEQERPKARGEGKTNQAAEAHLESIAADGSTKTLVARKVTDANARIVELTGLSSEQFRQVMVLPQGKFRELLLAPSGDRQRIFEQLFQTQVYTTIEKMLQSRSNEIEGEARDLRIQRQSLLDQIECESAEHLQEAIERLEPGIDAATQVRVQASAASTQATELLASSRALAGDFDALSKARDAIAALEANMDEQVARVQRERDGKRASEIEASRSLLQVRQKEASDARDKVQGLEEALPPAQEAEAGAAASHAVAVAREPERSQLLEQVAGLRALVEAVVGVAKAEQDWKQTAELAAQTHKALDKARQAHEAKKTNLTALRESTTALRTAIDARAELPAQQERMRALSVKRDALAAIDATIESVGAQLSKAHATLEAARTRQLAAEARVRDLESARLRGQAAVLASGLQTNTPCPVCGSTEHPLPARAEQAIPDEEAIESARETETRERKAVENCTTTHGTLAGKLEEQRGQRKVLAQELGDTVGSAPGALKAQLSELENAVAKLGADRKQLERFANDIKTGQKELQAEAASLEAQVNAAEQARQDAAVAEARFMDQSAAIPERYREHGVLEMDIHARDATILSIAEAIERAAGELQTARVLRARAEEALTRAREECEGKQTAHRKAADAWGRELQQKGFATEADFETSRMAPDALRALQLEIRAHDDARLTANESLRSIEARTAGKTAPDLPALVQAAEEARHLLESAQSALNALQNQRSRYAKTSADLAKLDARGRGIEEEYAVVGRLSQVATGNNDSRISLQRYVLSVLLDDVLAEAGERLHRMSKGRYRLLRRQETQDRRSKAGLELDVEDSYTGINRSVATLSGGESFMAALAMALGLSEIVQNYAGGIKLDTLFIDEGFGSLDPEALDLATRTLIDLQAAGRMVGVISHVPEMKQQIGTQLVVEPGMAGSRVRVVSN